MSSKGMIRLALSIALGAGLLLCGTPSRAGQLFVSLNEANTIVSYDTTASTPTPTTFASGLNGPNYLAFDSAGNLFVTMFQASNMAIDKFTPSGVESVFTTGGVTAPTAWPFDSAGNLFVANQTSGTIVKFTPGGVSSVFASGIEHADPPGLR